MSNSKAPVSEGGQFTAATDAVAQAGSVKATVGGASGVARVRVIPPLPWSENFDSSCSQDSPDSLDQHDWQIRGPRD